MAPRMGVLEVMGRLREAAGDSRAEVIAGANGRRKTDSFGKKKD
jgi:hypothetical protein